MDNKIELGKKEAQVKDVLLKLKKVVVAFSGGVDSTLILSFALSVLGKSNVKAVYFSSCLQTTNHEKQILSFIKSQFGSSDFLNIIRFNPLSDEQFLKNDKQKCYICKKNIYTQLKTAFLPFSSNFIDGTNYSDLSHDRPGYQAIKELGILTPLADSNLIKSDIRQLAKKNNLHNWNLPSNSCLATRVIEGERIAMNSLKMIEKAENFLINIGITGARVKKNGIQANIMIPQQFYKNINESRLQKNITDYFIMLGFGGVCLRETSNKE